MLGVGQDVPSLLRKMSTRRATLNVIVDMVSAMMVRNLVRAAESLK